MKSAMLRLLKHRKKALLAASCWLVAIGLLSPTRAADTVVLTNAAQLRSIPSAVAAGQLPVQLRATATAFNPSSIFLQDATGGTFINLQGEHPPIMPGDVVEVQGVTYVGRFLTGISPAAIRVVGHGPLPAPVPVSFDDLLSTRYHYERVQIDGVVRTVTHPPSAGRLVLTIAAGARKLEIQIADPAQTNPGLVDATVRVEGLAAGYINNSRQLIAPHLLVSRLDDVHILTPPPSDPFKLPVTSASDLLTFTSSAVSNHRVRVRGVVTHRQPQQAIYLRDSGRGLEVQTAQADSVHPGDIVEVAGFPAMGAFSAFLEDAEFRVTGHGETPQAVPATLVEVLSGTNDANLISLEAQVLEVLNNPAESVLVARSSDTVFPARMPRASLNVRKGSYVRLSGVCRVEDFRSAGAGFGVNPTSIELLLRTPADVAIVSAPTWWTAQRLSITAATLLGLALAALMWVGMLRRRLAEQTSVIREQVQREAALEERHRMAREMHDTLAQSFSGLGFQLDALGSNIPTNASGARKQLETARQMVRHGQEGFRRSLLNLRAQELERGSLEDALRELARQMTAGTGIELRCELRHPSRNLPESVETNLLRIGQECLANAVRHGQPGRIDLELEPAADFVRLRIADDGAGFDPGQLAHSSNGHFGWKGIRERSDQIGANVDLKSERGRGTVVTVTVPI
jgi:signal transduction histidine kinase